MIQESSVLLTVQADQDSVSLQLCHVNGIQLLIAWGKINHIISYFVAHQKTQPPLPPQALFTVIICYPDFLKALRSQDVLGEAQSSLFKAGI